MKTWAIGLMSNEEKQSILDKHKTLYDGYRTMQPEVLKQQPLYVQDFANDKGGVTLSNKNNITTYKNVGINEQVDESECLECGDKGYMEEEKEMCSECGGVMMEGECSECGWKGEMEEETQQVKDLDNVEDLNLSDKFDYVEGEVEETQQGNPYDNMDTPFTFRTKGPKDGGDAYSVKADDMDLDDEEVKSPFDFESEGPRRVYETMVSAFVDDSKGFDIDRPINAKFTEPKEETIVLDMEGYMGDEEDDEDFLDDVDEDLKESVIIQKNRITEMMNRMKRY